MSTLDVQRATAIITRGQEHGYFPEGKMPESETDRIVEAEKLVVLAQQVEVLAKEIGKHNIPGWPAAEAILFEAQVTMGSSESNGHTAPAETPDQTTVEDPSSEVAIPERLTTTIDDTEEPGPGLVDAAVADMKAATQDRYDSPEPVTTREKGLDPLPGGEMPRCAENPANNRSDPQDGEVWADAQGKEWEVLSYGGGPSAEVMKVSTSEKTLVPAGMLKTKVRDAPSDETVEVPETDIATGEPDHEPTEKPAIQRFREAVTKVAAALPTPEAPDTSIPEHDDEGDERYQSILAETEERYTPAGWVIPHELQEPPDLMPEMLDQVPDVMAQRYHSQFNAAAARAKYLHDVEDARARGCKLTRKLFLRGAMRKAREELGGSSTITEREAWAEDFDNDVKVWGERANKHEENARAWKTFFDLYTQNVVVLSRDWTMRDQQEKS